MITMYQDLDKKRLACVTLFAGFFLMAAAGKGLAQPGAGYRIKKSVIDQGGGRSYSTGYQVLNAVGQTGPVGMIQSLNYTVSSGFLAGETALTGVDEVEIPQDLAPADFKLYQNYPNPFNPETAIRFGVKEPCRVELTVIDLLGREVSVLENDHYQPGQYQVLFDASRLPSGIYFYWIRMGNFEAIKKMVLLE
jgi:hypothetical protein